jgi:DNA polymerase-3 subunit delta
MSTISAEQMAVRLQKGKPVPAIVLIGTDRYLRDLCREQIVDATVDPASRDWAVARFSAEDDSVESILRHAQSLPMLAPRQAMIVSDLEAIEKKGEEKRETAIQDLERYLNDPAPFTVLILESAGLDQRMRLAKMLSEKALLVSAELPSDPEERLDAGTKIAMHMASELKTSIGREAAENLVELCNCDLAAVHCELEKLALYVAPGAMIQQADVEALVFSEKKYSVWELADVLASQDRLSAFKFLDKLLRDGEQPPALIGAMAWMFRKLIEAQDLSGHISAGQAAGKLKMRIATAELALRQARKIPRPRLVEGMRALYEADSRLKSGAKNDRAILEFLMARLVGVPAEPQALSAGRR